MIVIGAGLSGCVTARQLAESGCQIDLYEKKAHIGGAVYDYVNAQGVTIHQYGPHIFHTNSEEVYTFIQRYAQWNTFEHKVLGSIQDKLCPIPFNLASIEMCFAPAQAARYREKLIAYVGEGNTITIGELSEIDDGDLKQLANFVYENVFLHYTQKQWGREPQELGGNVMGRVPVRASYQDGYFADRYQLMPQKGYTDFLQNVLDHKNIHVHLNCDADDLIRIENGAVYFGDSLYAGDIVYTGCIDRLLGYRHGDLPYRTLRFEFETQQWPYQSVAVVNYPNAPEFTRITEFGHFYPDRDYEVSTIMREYPQEYKRDAEQNAQLEPYYPIRTAQSEPIHRLYMQEANKIPNLHLAGRLGSYRYMNMDVAILESLKLASRIIGKPNCRK